MPRKRPAAGMPTRFLSPLTAVKIHVPFTVDADDTKYKALRKISRSSHDYDEDDYQLVLNNEILLNRIPLDEILTKHVAGEVELSRIKV